jgi:K+-transporting ATPase KdpF subunit
MGLLNAIDQNLGLTSLAVIAVVLVVYLSYSMLYPERF